MKRRIRKFYNFINEDLKTDLIEKLGDENREIKEEIVERIIKSLESEDKEVFDEFIKSFIRDSEKNKIEGLINDSDIYEFYLQFRNDIDMILSDKDFYDEVPSEMDCFSLYDYIVRGTTEAIKEVVKSIKTEMDKQEGSEGQSQSEGEEGAQETDF